MKSGEFIVIAEAFLLILMHRNNTVLFRIVEQKHTRGDYIVYDTFHVVLIIRKIYWR